MTSTLSQNKKSVFFTRVVQHIKESTAFAIIICIIMLFSSVINIVNFSSYPRMYRYGVGGEESASQIYFTYEDLALSVFQGLSITFICMILAALIAVKCFRHLHKKSLVDLEYSLPLTTNQRFLASGIATFVLIIGATMVSALVTHIFAYSMLNDSTEFGEMFAKSGGKFADVADLFFRFHLTTLSEMLLLVATGVFALCCCGVLFDAVVYAGGGSILVALTALVVQAITQHDLYKFVATSFGSQWVAYITPFYSILDSEYYNYIYVEGVVDLSPLTSLCIGRYLIAAALCVAAFFIHTKRRAEGVGKPFTFKPFYYAVTTLLMFCLTAFAYNSHLQSEFNAYDDYSSKGTVIMISMIMLFAFLVLEVLAERKSVFTKKRVIQGVVRLAVTVPLCLAVAVGLRELGKNTMVGLPEADEVSVVSISCNVIGSSVVYCDDGEIRFDEAKIDINPAVFDSQRFNNCCNFTNKKAVEDVLAFAEEVNKFEKSYMEEHGDFYVFDVYSVERDSVKMYCYVDIFTKKDQWVQYSFDLSQDFVKQWIEEYLTDDETYGEYSSWY